MLILLSVFLFCILILIGTLLVRKMVRKLEAAPVTITNGTPDAYRALRDPAMHHLGIGTTHDMNSVITGIFIPSLKFRGYTVTEKINLWLGKSRSLFEEPEKMQRILLDDILLKSEE